MKQSSNAPATIPGGRPSPLADSRVDKRPDGSLYDRTFERFRPDERLVSLVSPASLVAEQYRTLSLVLEQRRQTGTLQIVAITSPSVGDGKTTTAINLAGAFAQSPGSRVLLMDLDLRHPSVAGYLGIRDNAGPGLRDAVVHEDLPLKEVAKRYSATLSVVTGGRTQIPPHECLKSPRLQHLLQEARHEYEWIILDTSPLVMTPDCLTLEKWLDGFVMVVSAHHTSRILLEEALNSIEPSKLLGFVFNGDERLLSTYSYTAYLQARSS